MTEEEALVFLEISDAEDRDDAYEEHMFAHKQFFLSKAIIPSVFLKRMEKVEQLEHAFTRLGGIHRETSTVTPQAFEPSNEVQTHVQRYQQLRNELKLGIAQAENGAQLLDLIRALLRLEGAYIAAWKVEQTDEVLLGKEPDPMEVWQAVKTFHGTFDQLKRDEKDAPVVLVNEMKRLSLLFKKFPWTTY